MPDISATAAQLIAADLPVMFLDTCILLDVIRAIKRRNGNSVRPASDLLAAVRASPRKCRVVVSYVVNHEWGVNNVSVLDEARQHLHEIEEQAAHFHNACNVLGIVPGFACCDYAKHGTAEALHDLSRSLLDQAIEIEEDYECSASAIRRILYGTPPSKKGGEAKDCTILEQYLAVSRILHAHGFGKRLVFCTSNTSDYCTSKKLHVELSQEFATVGLDFAADLHWGFHAVTH